MESQVSAGSEVRSGTGGAKSGTGAKAETTLSGEAMRLASYSVQPLSQVCINFDIKHILEIYDRCYVMTPHSHIRSAVLTVHGVRSSTTTSLASILKSLKSPAIGNKRNCTGNSFKTASLICFPAKLIA